jgi:hypothetical protein
LVVVEVDFLKAVERRNPGGDMFDMVPFEVERSEVFTPFYIRRNPFQVASGEIKLFNGIVIVAKRCARRHQQG